MLDEVTILINQLTDALPTPGKMAAGPKPTTRDWAGFFAAVAAFAAKILPLILPLLVTPAPADEPK